MRKKGRSWYGSIGGILLMVGLGISGCVTVETTVRPNGQIIRRYEVQVRPIHQAMARAELQSYLGKGWKKPRLNELSVDKTIVWAERKFRDARELPYVQAQLHGPYARGRFLQWQRYVYEETIPLKVFLSTAQESQLASKLEVTYRIRMPGTITRSGLRREGGTPPGQDQGPHAPGARSGVPLPGPGATIRSEGEVLPEDLRAALEPILADTKTAGKVSGNGVSWTFPLGEAKGFKIAVESERLNYVRLVFLILFLLVGLAAAAYVLRPLWLWIGRKLRERAAVPPEERERQRQEREERKRQQAEERQRRQQEAAAERERRAQERAAQKAARDAQRAEQERQKAQEREQKKLQREAQRAARKREKEEARERKRGPDSEEQDS